MKKKLASQIENYFFGVVTLIFDYAVAIVFFREKYFPFSKLDIFFVQFSFSQKKHGKKNSIISTLSNFRIFYLIFKFT